MTPNSKHDKHIVRISTAGHGDIPASRLHEVGRAAEEWWRLRWSPDGKPAVPPERRQMRKP